MDKTHSTSKSLNPYLTFVIYNNLTHVRWVLTMIATVWSGLLVYAQLNSSESIKSIIDFAEIHQHEIVIEGKILYSQNLIAQSYQSNDYTLLWKKNRNINAMLMAIKKSSLEGLDPNDYHFNLLEKYFHLKRKSELQKAYFDLLLSDAFLTYAQHLSKGKINPLDLYEKGWDTYSKHIDYSELLLLANTEKNVPQVLQDLTPAHQGYKDLKQQLSYFRSLKLKIAWPAIKEGKSIHPGDADERIPSIRWRLLNTGQYNITNASTQPVYDSALFMAVKLFQLQHGLQDDGIIGRKTIQMLNLNPDDYIDIIIVNLERYRWLPKEFEQPYAYINIPDYTMQVYEYDSVVMSMRVIVGRAERKTPVLSSSIKYITLNPTWTIPPTILKEDVLPAIKRNINYLSKNNLRVIDRSGKEVDPLELPWNSYTENNFPYIIRQDPGFYNSLGLLKFSFPNNYTVFLHDTNYRALFKEHNRALSSGCIRIEFPLSFAEYLYQDADRLNKGIASKETIALSLRKTLPIHLVYFTAFTNANGLLEIREDIYKYDEALLLKLKQSL